VGLDWNPLARPRPGFEGEFERLLTEIEGGTVARHGLGAFLSPRKLTEAELEERRARFREISEPPFATLGAPRVGFDEAADAWLRGRLEEAGKIADLELAQEKMHGYYVLDLLPPCDGFALYTHNGLYEGVDRCSFRAKFLEDAESIIGPALLERAYDRMLARDLAAYADALDAAVRPWATRAGVLHVEHASDAPEYGEDSAASQADILFSAIRWCRFWSARGHGLDPWW
jgi:hypothetical protein